MLLEEIDGVRGADHPLSRFLLEAGFVAGAMGLQARSARSPHPGSSLHPAPLRS
jgi:hypothetical protein